LTYKFSAFAAAK